jgi:hypothetical protein
MRGYSSVAHLDARLGSNPKPLDVLKLRQRKIRYIGLSTPEQDQNASST